MGVGRQLVPLTPVADHGAGHTDSLGNRRVRITLSVQLRYLRFHLLAHPATAHPPPLRLLDRAGRTESAGPPLAGDEDVVAGPVVAVIATDSVVHAALRLPAVPGPALVVLVLFADTQALLSFLLACRAFQSQIGQM